MRHRRRFKQTTSLKERFASFAKEIRDKARLMPPCREREDLLKRASRADTASHLDIGPTHPDCSRRSEKQAAASRKLARAARYGILSPSAPQEIKRQPSRR
jgi:hypothetical protein